MILFGVVLDFTTLDLYLQQMSIKRPVRYTKPQRTLLGNLAPPTSYLSAIFDHVGLHFAALF
jgi:hypothetical protein